MNERRDDGRVTTADPTAADAERRAQESRRMDTPPASGPASGEEVRDSLFAGDEGTRFRERWEIVQAGFVDEPRRAVEDADALVADVMKRITAGFAGEREKLTAQWSRGSDISTEDLRQALRRYRAFFDRLLSV
jgi:hypothetical protein